MSHDTAITQECSPGGHIHWHQAAAEAADPVAMYNIGYILLFQVQLLQVHGAAHFTSRGKEVPDATKHLQVFTCG